MASRTEQAIYTKTYDAKVLDEAASVVRRRMKKPAGISTALFCRTLTTEASMIRAEVRALREEPSK